MVEKAAGTIPNKWCGSATQAQNMGMFNQEIKRIPLPSDNQFKKGILIMISKNLFEPKRIGNTF